MWKLVAKIVSRPTVANWLIKRAQRTPYFHLKGYMNRWWLFNHYNQHGPEEERHERKIKWLPAIRIHHILREDLSPDLHDHPWNARTIILKGWYREEKETDYPSDVRFLHRKAGDTATLNYGEFHNIKEVSLGGVWTMFFTWDYEGTWGFLVDGAKVPWKEYEDNNKRVDA